MTREDYIYYRELLGRLRAALLELAANPAASVTVSTGDGQKSISYKSLSQVKLAIAEVEAKCAAYERALAGRSGYSVGFVNWS